MSVYREGFMIVEDLFKNQVRIFADACDEGVPVRKNDKIWNSAKQLIDWYGVEGTRRVFNYTDGPSVERDVKLINEWAVSDGDLTVEEATFQYHVGYIPCKKGRCKGFDGFIFIYKSSK